MKFNFFSLKQKLRMMAYEMDCESVFAQKLQFYDETLSGLDLNLLFRNFSKFSSTREDWEFREI